MIFSVYKNKLIVFLIIFIGFSTFLYQPKEILAANPGSILSSGRYASLQDGTQVDFGCGSTFCDVKVYDDKLTGRFYIPIPEGPFVDLFTTNTLFQVKNNGAGILSGAALGLAPGGGAGEIGPVLFNSPPFKVTINPNTGEFSGYAFSSAIGTIKFECPGASCVITDWRPAGLGAGASGSYLPIDGKCGNANTKVYSVVSAIPVSDYCVSGAGGATPVSGSGTAIDPWVWNCLGLYSGTQSSSCKATKTPIVVPVSVKDLCPSILGIQTKLPCTPKVVTPVTPTQPIIEPEIPTPIEVPIYIPPVVTTPLSPVAIPYDPQPVLNIIILLGLLAGIPAALIGTLFFHSKFSNLSFIPTRITQLFKQAFLKPKRFWGTVYDSTTGESVDPVKIYLRDVTGVNITSTTTDMYGRYGFSLEKGIYKIYVKGRNYSFPSTKLFGKTKDDFYDDLYTGGDIVINEKFQNLKLNIPIDTDKPVAFLTPSQKIKKAQRLIRSEKWVRNITGALFGLGFIFSGIASFFTMSIYNFILLGVYVLIVVLRKVGVFKYLPKGSIALADGEPASYVKVKAYLTGAPSETAMIVTDRYGRYYLPVPNGVYVIKIDANTKMGYLTAMTSNPITVEEGAINKDFKF